MLIALIVVLLLIQFVRRQQTKKKGTSFIFQHRVVLTLLVITSIPIFWFNYSIPVRKIKTADEFIEHGKETCNFRFIRIGYDRKFDADPMNVQLRFDYIEDSRIYSANDCEAGVYALYFKDTITEILTKAYTQLTCTRSLESELFEELSKVSNRPFKNYLLGFAAFSNNNPESVSYLKQEIKINPNYLPSYDLLSQYYFEHNEFKKLDAFISHPNNRTKINVDFRKFYHFTSAHFYEYVYTIYENQIKPVQFPALFAALVISLLWLFYLWKLDVFKPEKWYNLLIVFCLGAAFTFLCLPIYDVANYIYQFEINGNFANDFLFSFLVIGGGEELVKFLPWFLFALFTKKLKEPFDYILYACVSALGFAFAENWMYLEDAGNITIRALISTIGHMFDASIIAYGFILYHFRYSDKKWRILLPIAGFILAAFSHGFYDFWLLSPIVQNFSYITILFFILTLHFWFHFKNNAINNSKNYASSIQLNTLLLQDLVSLSMIGILMLEYIYISYEYGARSGNRILFSHAPIVGVFIVYFNYQVGNLKIEPGVWSKFAIKLPSFFSQFNFSSFNFFKKKKNNSTGISQTMIGKAFTFYTSKSNTYIGNQLPISGKVTHEITVDNDDSWFAVELFTPINYSNYEKNVVLVRTVIPEQSMNQDKVEVLFLLVPGLALLGKVDLQMKDFRYTGKVFARPKH